MNVLKKIENNKSNRFIFDVHELEFIVRDWLEKQVDQKVKYIDIKESRDSGIVGFVIMKEK